MRSYSTPVAACSSEGSTTIRRMLRWSAIMPV
uniref:Uncharacterized protein n=1 Tax=Siphoviridae sp. ctBLh2 TaxID=2827803 RepID=A0A8S5S3S6_9CAUD|nr:MAG TPA: hypothetical protein [Siphoviridae sp. ctBLh2]